MRQTKVVPVSQVDTVDTLYFSIHDLLVNIRHSMNAYVPGDARRCQGLSDVARMLVDDAVELYKVVLLADVSGEDVA